MKLLKFFTLFSIIFVASATSPAIIYNTKEHGLIGDIMGDYCSWDGAKIFPGGIAVYFPGQCRQLECTRDFNVIITYCAFDMSGRHKWVGGDNSKPYPECCGDWVDTYIAAERV